MIKNIIREIRDKVEKNEDITFRTLDKEIDIKFDFYEKDAMVLAITFSNYYDNPPFYYDTDVIYYLYRNIHKNGSIDGKYSIPLYKKKSFREYDYLKGNDSV